MAFEDSVGKISSWQMGKVSKSGDHTSAANQIHTPFRHSFWQVHCSIDLDFVPLVVEIGILFC